MSEVEKFKDKLLVANERVEIGPVFYDPATFSFIRNIKIDGKRVRFEQQVIFADNLTAEQIEDQIVDIINNWIIMNGVV